MAAAQVRAIETARREYVLAIAAQLVEFMHELGEPARAIVRAEELRQRLGTVRQRHEQHAKAELERAAIERAEVERVRVKELARQQAEADQRAADLEAQAAQARRKAQELVSS
jgi:hypothetical protein